MTDLVEIADTDDYISTHILTKRMTEWNPLKPTPGIFQLISSRRGWLWATRNAEAFLIFQLTSSRRGWLQFQDPWSVPHHISTHILTKRMTVALDHNRRRIDISTHILTKRMTIWPGTVLTIPGYFNSHPHEEDDLFHFKLSPFLFSISTHILTKRMTEWRQKLFLKNIFQLTSSRRGWR